MTEDSPLRKDATPVLPLSCKGGKDTVSTSQGEAFGFRGEAFGFRGEAFGFRDEAFGFRGEAPARDVAVHSVARLVRPHRQVFPGRRQRAAKGGVEQDHLVDQVGAACGNVERIKSGVARRDEHGLGLARGGGAHGA